MNKKSVFSAIFILASASTFILGTGCNQDTVVSNANGNNPSQTANENGVSVSSATPQQCPDGGVVVESFIDLNHDGTPDSGDPILSTTPICNGSNGSNGLGSGIQVSQANANQCPSGGFQFTTFEDPNNTGVFQSGDTVTSTNIVCNGADGANGNNGATGNSFGFSETAASANQCSAGGVVYTVNEFNGDGDAVAGSSSSTIICNGMNGTNGTNGSSAVFTTVAASAEQCPSGGNVLLMASDTAQTGVYAPTDADQESVVICDGANGAQGAAGPVSPFTTIVPIMPCGEASSPYKEVLLCMADGNILADFSEDAAGEDTRLSFIPTGTYEDTDSSGCVFSVGADQHGGLTVSWSAGSNSYSNWNAGSYDCPATSTD